MKEEDLTMGAKKRKKYSTYQGEISLSVENIIDRDFHAPDAKSKEWLKIMLFRLIFLPPLTSILPSQRDPFVESML